MVHRTESKGSAVVQQSFSAVEEEVLDTVRARQRATIERDGATLERVMTDDVVYVHPTNARLETRAERIDAVVTNSHYKAFDLSDLQVRVGADMAVVTGSMDVTTEGADGDRVLNLRFTDVYARRDGRWQEIAFQATNRGDA